MELMAFRRQQYDAFMKSSVFHLDTTSYVDSLRAVTVVVHNCAGAQLEFDVAVAVYNVDKKGRRDYISSGERPISVVYSIFAALTVVALCVWLAYCYQHRQQLWLVHKVMGSFLAVHSVKLAL